MQPVPQGVRRPCCAVRADHVHRAGDRIGAASTCRNRTCSDARYASDVSGEGVCDPRAPWPHTSRRTSREVAARRDACRQFRQAPRDAVAAYGIRARHGIRSALLHLDEAAVHGPSFCYLEACADWPKQLCESGASAPDSLFIAKRDRVNKKQPFSRTKVKKSAMRDHQRTMRMRMPPPRRCSGGFVVGSIRDRRSAVRRHRHCAMHLRRRCAMGHRRCAMGSHRRSAIGKNFRFSGPM